MARPIAVVFTPLESPSLLLEVIGAGLETHANEVEEQRVFIFDFWVAAAGGFCDNPWRWFIDADDCVVVVDDDTSGSAITAFIGAFEAVDPTAPAAAAGEETD